MRQALQHVRRAGAEVDAATMTLALVHLAYCLSLDGVDEEAGKLVAEAKELLGGAEGYNQGLFAYAVMIEGTVHHRFRRLAQAEERYRRALTLFEGSTGRTNTDYALALQRLGRVRELQGDTQEAEAAYGQALEILERIHGPEHALLSMTLSYLAQLYTGDGRLEQACAAYVRAARNLSTGMGPDVSFIARINGALDGLRAQVGEARCPRP